MESSRLEFGLTGVHMKTTLPPGLTWQSAPQDGIEIDPGLNVVYVHKVRNPNSLYSRTRHGLAV